MNQLHYGDNLQVLRESLAEESVDLIYLDPPFNSKRDYNLFFKSPKGHKSEAQSEAFKDSWTWGMQAERAIDELLHQPDTEVALLLRARRGFLGKPPFIYGRRHQTAVSSRSAASRRGYSDSILISPLSLRLAKFPAGRSRGVADALFHFPRTAPVRTRT